MPLTQVIANTLFTGSFALSPGRTVVSFGSEVKAVAPLNANSYYDLVWSASFDLTLADTIVDCIYAPESSEVRQCVGWYRVLYGDRETYRGVITWNEFVIPKTTGVILPTSALVTPGVAHVVGSGGTVSVRNIASDRPYRGDTLEVYLMPGFSGSILTSVITNLNNNITNTNTYYVVP